MFDKILLAIDINDPSGAARSVAATRQIAPQEAELHVLVVVPDFGLPIVAQALTEAHADQAIADTRAALRDWIGTHLPGAAGHVAQGTVYDQILKTADALGVDAIIVGAHRPEFQDYLVGPNAARVVRHADQSVFVIR